MKKLISMFTVALFLCIGMNSFAQVTIPAANTNTNGDRHPYGFFFGFERTAIIYTATEIGQFGNVTKIGFFLNSQTLLPATLPIVIKMNTTTASALLNSQTYATTSTGATTVFTGNLTAANYVVGAWVEVTLDTPFPYNSDNLLVLVEANYGGGGISGGSGTNVQFRRSAPSPAANRMTVWNADNAPPTATASPSATRSNVQLTFGSAPAIDVGVSAASVGLPGMIISAGKGYNVNATVKNSGTATQNVVPVYYTVNGGSAIGPVNTVGPIAQGGTENVVFSSGNAFVPLSAGSYVLKVYTALGSDASAANDTTTLNISVLDKVVSFPYVMDFTAATGWTVIGNAVWSLGNATNPDGIAANPAAIANFYSISAGATLILRSPEMDFTGMSNPVLDFYVAYKTYTGGESDTVKVMVSTDGGLNFSPASTTYNKSWDSDPSLATLPAASGGFVPGAATDWRHETVDLSNVGNLGNVVIGFVGVSDFGNNAWVDNVIVSQPNSLCTDAVGPAPGTYSCNSLVSLDFTATPIAPAAGNQNIEKTVKNIQKSEFVSNIPSTFEDVVINSGSQFDNPNGGTAFISQYTNNDPGQTVAPNVGFTNATPPTGPAFDPTFVYHDYWFTVTYNGNDYTGYATYNISIDLDGLLFTDPTKLYVVKRTDRTGSWVCQNTTMSGNALVVTGLTDFSDFALAGSEALPVELSSFVSSVNGNSVNLNWSTASETNNSGFDVERSAANGNWSKVGNVTGNGTTSNSNNYSFTDRNLNAGNYSYRLKQIDFNGNFEYFNLSSEVNIGIPTKFDISQNYPNPFNPSTKISYDLPVDGKVSIMLFDMSGREVATLVNEVKTAGYYSVNFNASSLSSGVYFYRISAGNFTATKKMMLVK